MTAPEQTRPTAEHIDAVAVEFEHVVVGSGYYAMNIGTSAANESARAILTSSNPETHEALAANLPADVMLAALVRAGVLTVDLMTLSDGYAGRLVTEWGAADLGGNAWAVAP